TSGMAERVTYHLPSLARRMLVAPHPVSPRPRTAVSPGLVVCPVLFAPYKRMHHHLEILTNAVRRVRTAEGIPLDVRVTATRDELVAVGLGDADCLRPV